MREYEGKLFVFESEFGWINASGASGLGYSLFRQRKKSMTDLSPIDFDTTHTLSSIIGRIQSQEETTVYTATLPSKGYCALLPDQIHRGEDCHPDGECESYWELDGRDIYTLKKSGIEVITLKLD